MRINYEPIMWPVLLLNHERDVIRGGWARQEKLYIDGTCHSYWKYYDIRIRHVFEHCLDLEDPEFIGSFLSGSLIHIKRNDTKSVSGKHYVEWDGIEENKLYKVKRIQARCGLTIPKIRDCQMEFKHRSIVTWSVTRGPIEGWLLFETGREAQPLSVELSSDELRPITNVDGVEIYEVMHEMEFNRLPRMREPKTFNGLKVEPADNYSYCLRIGDILIVCGAIRIRDSIINGNLVLM